MSLLHWINETLFPPKCILCGSLLAQNQTDLCHSCREDAPVYSAGKRKLQFLDSWTAVWYYEGWVRKSILRYKFFGARHLAQGYGRQLAMKLLQTYPDGFDVITWVPTGKLRRLRRGYDQVKLIAQVVGAELEMEPVMLLRKIRNNPPQSRQSGMAARRANVLGVYCLENIEKIPGRRILLLDDILTTGATAGECARMLLTAGAKEVHCAVLAAAHNHESKTSR